MFLPSLAVEQEVFITTQKLLTQWATEAFLEMGFPKHLVALLRSLHVCKPKSNNKMEWWSHEEFQIGKGARQGCILSPHLFVTYTEKGMRDAEVYKYGVNVGGKLISNLRYADDTALLANSKDEITQLTNSVNDAGKELNLRLNVKKTKIMVAGAVPEEEHNIMIDGENVEQVDRFKYLGSTKTANANCSNDIKSRIAIAKKRMIDLQVIWNDTNLSIQLKMKLVKTLVWSALLYGAESWTLFKADVNRIMAAEMWFFWRRMLNINWKQKRTNANVLLELGTERQLLGKVISLKMGYFGHTVRGSGSPLALDIIEGKVEGKRKPGRQKKKWSDNIKEWTGLNYVQAKRAAQLSKFQRLKIQSFWVCTHGRLFLNWKVNLSDWIFNLWNIPLNSKIENSVWKIDFSIQKSLPWVHTQKDWIFNLWNLERRQREMEEDNKEECRSKKKKKKKKKKEVCRSGRQSPEWRRQQDKAGPSLYHFTPLGVEIFRKNKHEKQKQKLFLSMQARLVICKKWNFYVYARLCLREALHILAKVKPSKKSSLYIWPFQKKLTLVTFSE